MPLIDRRKKLGNLAAWLSLGVVVAGGSAWAQTEPPASEDPPAPSATGQDAPKAPEAPVVSSPAKAGVATEPSPPPPRERIERKARAVPDSEVPSGYSGKGFALEALTSSFASGGLGSLLVGYKGRLVTIGGNLGFAKYTSTSTTLGSEDRLAGRFGPGVRVAVGHSDDERAELFLHGDIGLIILNSTVPAVANRSEGTATSAAFQLGVGAGVRYWLCPNLALGYVAMVKYTSSINQPSDVIVLEVPTSMGTQGWFLDGSFVIASVF
jgi:hypothetical protein